MRRADRKGVHRLKDPAGRPRLKSFGVIAEEIRDPRKVDLHG